ncbi:MAG: hypothetical protein QM698_10705 [Micropepsaceae bacterium]
MRRITLAALACASVAFAMPGDLPWEPFACDAGKTLDVKYLSDGLAIGVRLNADDASTLTLVPADEDKQAGFKDGDYRGEGDTLLVLKYPAVTLTGAGVTGAPYENCKPIAPPPAG